MVQTHSVNWRCEFRKKNNERVYFTVLASSKQVAKSNAFRWLIINLEPGEIDPQRIEKDLFVFKQDDPQLKPL